MGGHEQAELVLGLTGDINISTVSEFVDELTPGDLLLQALLGTVEVGPPETSCYWICDCALYQNLFPLSTTIIK